MAWHSWTSSHGSKSREQAVEVLVGPVPPPLPSPGFFHLQRHLKCQNLPWRPQIHPPGLSRPRASRGCSQQALRRGAWSGPPSRAAPGRRRAWTTPTRNPGSLRRPEVSPGQAGGREGWGQVGTGGGGVAGHCGRGFPPPPHPQPCDAAGLAPLGGGIPDVDPSPTPPLPAARPAPHRMGRVPPVCGYWSPPPIAWPPSTVFLGSGRAAPAPRPPLTCRAAGAIRSP